MLFEGIGYYCLVLRACFGELNMNSVQDSMELVERCLRDSRIDKRNVHEVVREAYPQVSGAERLSP